MHKGDSTVTKYSPDEFRGVIAYMLSSEDSIVGHDWLNSDVFKEQVQRNYKYNNTVAKTAKRIEKFYKSRYFKVMMSYGIRQ